MRHTPEKKCLEKKVYMEKIRSNIRENWKLNWFVVRLTVKVDHLSNFGLCTLYLVFLFRKPSAIVFPIISGVGDKTGHKGGVGAFFSSEGLCISLPICPESYWVD